jgi:hypothetical protein
MSDKRPDGFTMIGLHKLAAQNGDGLVPELHDLLMKHAEQREHYANVAEFPVWDARLPGQPPEKPLGLAAANGNNVVDFVPARAGRKRKA